MLRAAVDPHVLQPLGYQHGAWTAGHKQFAWVGAREGGLLLLQVKGTQRGPSSPQGRPLGLEFAYPCKLIPFPAPSASQLIVNAWPEDAALGCGAALAAMGVAGAAPGESPSTGTPPSTAAGGPSMVALQGSAQAAALAAAAVAAGRGAFELRVAHTTEAERRAAQA